MSLKTTLILLISIVFSQFAFATIQLPDSIQKSIKFLNDTQKINKLNEYANAVYLKDFEAASAIIDSTISWSRRIQFKRGEANALMVQGLEKYYKGEYEAAANNYVKSIKIYESISDVLGQARVCNEMANLLRKHDKIEESKKYLSRAWELSNSIKNYDQMANSCNNTGIYFETLGQLDSALIYYNRALSLYDRDDNLTGMGYSYDYIGLVYAYKEEYDKSLSSMLKALEIRETLGEKQAQAVSLVNIGELLFAMNKIPDAKNYFSRSLNIANKMGFADLISYNNKMLSRVSAQTGDFKSAYLYQQKFSAVSDSLFSLKSDQQVAEIQTRYETEKKEKENVLLLQKNKEKELRIAQQRNQLFILLGILVVAVLAGTLFYYSSKLKQQQYLNAEIQRMESLRLKAIIDSQESERQRIAAELHDGLGQILSAARVNLASEEVSITDRPQITKSIQLIDRSCKELREISHNMMPSLLVNQGLLAALNELASSSGNTNKLSILIESDGLENRLNPEIEIHLFRIVQELLNNIIKYAQASEVQVQVLLEEKELTVMVEDNGVGFDKELLNSSSGNGWYNIQSRLKLINGVSEIDSKKGHGTVVTILVQLT